MPTALAVVVVLEVRSKKVSNFEVLSLVGIFSRYLWFWVWKLNGARAIWSLTQERAYRQIWRLGTNKLQEYYKISIANLLIRLIF
jgi:hypothetical protein